MVQFSSRMSQLKGSAIRELLALANKPEVLSFAGGMPAPELFPVDKIKAATDAVLDEQGRVALQYSSTNGFEHFRQQIADRMEAKLNIKTSADNILVTSGSQQGLDYSARVFCDKGDVVIIESPSYLGALNAFKACEPNFVAIPTDGDGMIMEELEKVLATTENVKMIYVIPDFQNPSGRTWPLERRKQFMDIINKYEIPVVEDNPYGELRFEGEYLPALKSTPRASLSSWAPSPRSWRPATVWAGSAPTARSSRSTTSSRRPRLCRLPLRRSSLSPSSSTCSTSTSTLPPSRSATASAVTS